MWRLAKSLIKLRSQIDALAPNRSKSSDGSIGDQAHAQRHSDHNPDERGVVHAIDITNDPAHGVNAHVMARDLVKTADSRIKYVISDGQIAEAKNGFRWTQYHGTNPHDKHFHISVVPGSKADDASEWKINLSPATGPGDAPIEWPHLHKGDKGETVGKLQQLLAVPVDNYFGENTEEAVKKFQSEHLITVDGIAGPYTWEALLHGPPKIIKVRHPNILATVFSSGESGAKGSYGKWIDDDIVGVALPFKFLGDRPLVRLSYRNRIISNIKVVDVGPWNKGDAEYVLGDARPRVERDQIDDFGRTPVNKAGIDLSPALARALNVDGSGVLDWWEFQ